MVIRFTICALTLLCVSTAIGAAPNPAPGSALAPPPSAAVVGTTAPAPRAAIGTPLPARICTAANAALPAPAATVQVINAYVQVTWASVPNATGYQITRIASNGQRVGLASLSAGNEYWDVVPDLTLAYQYVVTAVPPTGCPASTAMNVGPHYELGNPNNITGAHPDENHAAVIWFGVEGATAYRIDGPNIQTTGLYVPGDTYVPGKRPVPGGTPKPNGNGVIYYQYSVPVPLNAVAAGLYTVTAVYPGNLADYAHALQGLVPRVAPVITSISPTTGTLGSTVVTISGKYLTDPGDYMPGGLQLFPGVKADGTLPANGCGPQGCAYSVQSVSPTAITVVLGEQGYIKLFTYRAPGTVPSGVAISPVPYMGTAPPPPPPPTPHVRVPGVQWMPLVGAEKLLGQAKLNVKVISGPGTPTSLVSSEAPGLGALVNVGSVVNLSTTAGTGVAGINKLTLVNNTERSVDVWSFDTSTGQFTQQNDSGELAQSAQTEMTLIVNHVYLVYALDPSQCGANDPSNSQCWIWEGGFVGSSSGSGSCSMGSPQC